jgi:lipoate-protein ligase A
MTRASLRVIRSGDLEPARNMGIDAALLETGSSPTLRVYGWSPAGLSLGYFQAASPFDDVPGDHVVVRRITGGGAIYHESELTFALTCDAAVLPASIPRSYALVHDAIAAVLRRLGVPVRRVRSNRASRGATRAGWCFESPGANDLLTDDGRKLVGSAQRRIRSPEHRVLHHGSLVLRTPSATPFCACVEDYVSCGSLRRVLEDELVSALARSLSLEPVAGGLDDDERRLADMEERRQRDPLFVRRR